MSSIHTALLGDRAVLTVAGADARTFLQGLLTADVDKISATDAAFGGLLTPQGKILFDFFLSEGAGGALLIDTAHSLAADLAKRLGFYRLRAKVTVEIASGVAVAAAWGAAPAPASGLTLYRDPRTQELGWRLIGVPDALAAAALAQGWQQCDAAGYHAHRIATGVPDCGRDYLTAALFPHEALFDRHHGVDFKKGCYVGQEVVSRMEHRGTARSRFLTVTGSTELPERGSEVSAGGTPLGTLGSHQGALGLALLRIDRLQQALAAGHQPVTAGVSLTIDAGQLARLAVIKVAAP